MRKVFAWLGAATLYMLVSARADAANDVLKPYVVMILDTSNSMLSPTLSGPTSCGKVDTRLNHAVCAVNNIINSYGDMVFALGRYRETSSGAGTPGMQVCDLNGDQDGNVSNAVTASGGDVCNTQGVSCADCNPIVGNIKLCTAGTAVAVCQSDSCNTTAETACGLDTVDNDNDGKVNDGCPIVSGTGESGALCDDAVDSDGDTAVNDGCPIQGQCAGAFGCTNNDRNFELLAGLVDGGNASSGKFVDGVCNSCIPEAAGTNGEIWGIGDNTFGPLSASLLGTKRYWEGQALSSDNSATIWPAASPGFDPINRDPSNDVFLPGNAAASCNPNPTSCLYYAESGADCTDNLDNDRIGTSGVGAIFGDGRVNDGCPAVGAPETGDQCLNDVNDDVSAGDTVINDGCPAVCTDANCCCATQCRPYITILLADGDETCTSFANTQASAAALLNTRPRNDRVNISAISRTTTTGTVTAAGHPFAVGDAAFIVGVTGGSFNGTVEITGTTSTTVTYLDARGAGTGTVSGSSFIGHVAFQNRYFVQTKPIGFGVPPGDPEIEALAHAGGAPNIMGLNEGYYAADEADLQLAISQILAESVRSEVCNSRDDDCDTRVDEDFPQVGGTPPGTPAQACPLLCANGLPCLGECRGTGVFICDGMGGVTCNASNPYMPQTEVCNNLDDDCDGLIDDNIPGGCGTCNPTNEVCNGLNEDCDGAPDKICRCTGNTNKPCNTAVPSDCAGLGSCQCEDLTRPCGFGICAGIETCTGGVYADCTAGGGTEICNGADDDCDGVCDDELEISCSQIGGACNPNVQGSCPGSNNPGSPDHLPRPRLDGKNICSPGVRICPIDQACDGVNQFSSCSGEILPCGPDTDPGTPGCDGCDGLDNDCDNEVDENFISSDCSSNCGTQVTACTNGVITCPPATSGGVDNDCDNVDDDCDNKIDEHWVCEDLVAPFGGTAGCDPCGVGIKCNGVQACLPGGIEACQGEDVGVETCNCEDDDCDGKTDENPLDNICPGNATCVPGSCQCAFGCVPGEFPCPVGKKCADAKLCSNDADIPDAICTTDANCPNGTCDDEQFCVNDPCFDEVCLPANGNARTCIPNPQLPNSPQCVEICSLINDGDLTEYPPCPPTFVCLGSAGECRPNNCVTFPLMCSEDQSCVNGACVGNPCQGVTCETGKYCVGGTCVSSCSDVTCAAGQRCRQGVCETDPCGQGCPFGQACNDDTGQCIEDPCKVRQCPQGQWCNPNDGECEDDPCVASDITCPNAGEVCRGGTCIDAEELRPDAAGEAHVTVGGGGGCSTTGGGSGLLLALGLLLARRRGRVSPRAARSGGAL